MLRPFIVERKPFARMTDRCDTAIKCFPFIIITRPDFLNVLTKGRRKWILEKSVLDIGENEFLMLDG